MERIQQIYNNVYEKKNTMFPKDKKTHLINSYVSKEKLTRIMNKIKLQKCLLLPYIFNCKVNYGELLRAYTS